MSENKNKSKKTLLFLIFGGIALILVALLGYFLLIAPYHGYCGDIQKDEKSVQWHLGRDGTLTISGEGEVYSFAIKAKRKVKKIVFEEGITEIHSYIPGKECSEIQFSDSITYIGDGAFIDFKNLTDVTLPSKLTYLGSNAFENCTSLKEIVIPKGIKTISSSCFYGCSQLKKVTLPDGITLIDAGAFSDCRSLTEINIPEGLEVVESGAFADCTSLSSIILPESLKTIGDVAFIRSGIGEITIPAKVEKVGESAFNGCSNLKNVYFMGEAPYIGGMKSDGKGGYERNYEIFKDVTASVYHYQKYQESWSKVPWGWLGGTLQWEELP